MVRTACGMQLPNCGKIRIRLIALAGVQAPTGTAKRIVERYVLLRNHSGECENSLVFLSSY